VLLLLSVLRHASSVALTLPGIDAGSVEAVLARHGVAAEWTGGESILLRGRASAVGTWSGFGGRVARCTLQLMALCPRMPEGEARVHFGDQTLAFEIDGKAAAFARPAQRAVSDGAGIVLAAGLEDEIAGRRKAGDGLDGWTLRRWPGPVVVEGALVLPELTLTRGDTHVAIVAASKRTALAAIERVNQSRPAILLAEGPVLTDVPVLVASEAPKRLVELLAEIAPQQAGVPSPLELVAAELARANWIRWSDLVDRFGESGDPRTAVAPLTDTGEAVLLPDSGLYAAGVVAWLRTLVNGGPIDVGSLRRAALEAVANGAAADALTLYVLGESTLRVEPDRAAA
jgi:hypothetical protein